MVQVGMHPMEASAETSCKVFSAAVELDPHTLFEKVMITLISSFLLIVISEVILPERFLIHFLRFQRKEVHPCVFLA